MILTKDHRTIRINWEDLIAFGFEEVKEEKELQKSGKEKVIAIYDKIFKPFHNCLVMRYRLSLMDIVIHFEGLGLSGDFYNGIVSPELGLVKEGKIDVDVRVDKMTDTQLDFIIRYL